MNSFSRAHAIRVATELETQHFLAVQTLWEWQEVWELFYRNSWFQKKLFYSAQFAVRQSGLGNHYLDDIKQEALVEFAKSLQRDTSLGFDRERGSFGGFISTVVHRCCQKSLRRFRRHYSLPLDGDFLHPIYETQDEQEQQIDLRNLAHQIPEPYRKTVIQFCDGRSIEEIARKNKKSIRTVYRWLERSIELLQSRFVLDVEHE